MTENFCCAVLCYEETYSSFGTQNVAISRELEDTYMSHYKKKLANVVVHTMYILTPNLFNLKQNRKQD